MAKYSEIVALLEWADKKTQKPAKSGFGRKNKVDKDFDPVDYLQKKKSEIARLEKFFEDEKKLNKKDDKKPDDKSFGKLLTGLEWFIIGILSYPIVGPAYQALSHGAGGMIK